MTYPAWTRTAQPCKDYSYSASGEKSLLLREVLSGHRGIDQVTHISKSMAGSVLEPKSQLSPGYDPCSIIGKTTFLYQ